MIKSDNCLQKYFSFENLVCNGQDRSEALQGFCRSKAIEKSRFVCEKVKASLNS